MTEARAAVAQPAPPPDAAQATADKLLVSEEEYSGWRYYHVYCARCHGQDALGSVNAANLRHSVSEDGGIARDSFLVIVRNGSSENKEMRGFHELLSDEQIGHVYAYIKARSEDRLAPGRPRRAPARP